MPKPITPVNNVLLCLDRALNEEIILNGGIKLFLDPTWRPEWHATVTGVVAAIPIHANKNIQIGDEVAFSYRVIADRTCQKIDYFQSVFEQNNKVSRRFINGKGDKIIVQAMPGVISPIWVGYLLDRRGNHIDGVQGNEHDVDRWLSQFNFSSNNDFKFNNLFELNGKNYWRADLDDIFAKRIKGKVVSLSDRVVCTPIEVDVKNKIELMNGTPLPYQNVKLRYYDRGKVVSGGESLGIKEGQIVSFEEQYMEKYFFWNKEYFLIKQNRVNGVWA